MKKKLFTIALALFTTLGAHAQFEKDKAYVGASLSGIDLSYKEQRSLTLVCKPTQDISLLTIGCLWANSAATSLRATT